MGDNYIRSPIERFFNFNTCYMLKNKKINFYISQINSKAAAPQSSVTCVDWCKMSFYVVFIH